MKERPDEWIAILDYGSQYTQLIARRIREQNVFSEIVPFDTSAAALRETKPAGVILSGGPNSVFDGDAPKCDPEIFRLGIPVLGICYGMQLTAQTLGGRVKPASSREYGQAKISVSSTSALFKDLPADMDVWMSHGDQVDVLPAGFASSASSRTCPVAAMQDEARKIYAIQFHPEVAHTRFGSEMLRNFMFGVCGCRGEWRLADWVEATVGKIRAQTGETGEVVLGLSGGVDSTVAASLIHRAIGGRLHCIFVDNGLLRHGEAAQVETEFRAKMGFDLTVARAAPRFFAALKGIEEPEAKRKAIGKTFIDVFAEEARKLRGCRFLGQGTIYSDVIESSSSHRGPSETIKSHHNVGGLPPDLDFALVEPLRDLFKDEVRAVGRILGIDAALIDRQPFPGPGLGVRVLGEVTPEKVALLQQADLRLQEELAKLPEYGRIWQAFAILLPCRTVGVMGDRRTYEHVCAIRCVDSVDAMTADWTRLPYDALAAVSNRIINEVRGINRVIYDISSKPPATIEWE